MRAYINDFVHYEHLDRNNSINDHRRKRCRESPSLERAVMPTDGLLADEHAFQHPPSLQSEPFLYATNCFRLWKHIGMKNVIATSMTLISHTFSRCEMDKLVSLFRKILSSALNERILCCSASYVESKGDAIPMCKTSCVNVGVRDHGAVLELCVSKLIEMLKMVEDSEVRAEYVKQSDASHRNHTKPSLYGTESFLTFKEERDFITDFIGIRIPDIL